MKIHLNKCHFCGTTLFVTKCQSCGFYSCQECRDYPNKDSCMHSKKEVVESDGWIVHDSGRND